MSAPAPVTRHIDIVIAGAGFAGIGAAIRLKQAGFDDFQLFERAAETGGTWRDNTYPGCACDIESPLYSFSFAPNPRWSRMFSPQAEIKAYLQNCVEKFGITPHLRLNTDVETAAWDEVARVWHLQTSDGPVSAGVLIAAMGPLSEHAIPSIPGIEKFLGRIFHSARWDHSFDFKGKRVAVVGTGASAIQFVPQIQPQAEKLLLFQRTPAWVVPRMDRPFSPDEQRRYAHFPWILAFRRAWIYSVREVFGITFRHPWLMRITRRIALRHMARAIDSKELRTKLTPTYAVGCKRVLISNDFYPAVAQPNVEVIAAELREIKQHSVMGADGVERAADAIIFGTGFQVTDLPRGDAVKGRGGISLMDAWRGSPRAFLGTTVAGFPNMFVLLGPNTGLGHNSVVLMIEAQITQIIAVLKHLRAKSLQVVAPKAEKQAAFNEDLARKTRGTVWASGGCKSWYLDRTGYNSVLWPRSVIAFRRRLKRFEIDDYLFT